MNRKRPDSRRLCDALARLLAEESGLVREGEYAGVAAVQARIGALIAGLERVPRSPAVIAEVGRLFARRQLTARLLAERRAAVQGELDQLTCARRKLLGLGPAYGPGWARRGLTLAASA